MSTLALPTVRVGSIQVTALPDAEVDYFRDFEELYPTSPAGGWELWRQRHPETFATSVRPRFPYNCYLVQSQGSIVLIDTGLGPADAVIDPVAFGGMRTTQQLVKSLARHDVAPEDVDAVLFTHLDVDHVGWNMAATEDGNSTPTFGRARHVIHEVEWAAFNSPGWDPISPYNHIEAKIAALEGAVELELFGGEEVEVAPGVHAFRTPGHTPGHVSFRIEDGGEVAYVAGDVWVHPAQVANPDWDTATDRDPELARATRRSFVELVLDTSARVSPSHFPAPWFGCITTIDGEPRWVPVEAGADSEAGR